MLKRILFFASALLWPSLLAAQATLTYTVSTPVTIKTTSTPVVLPTISKVLQVCTLPGSSSNVWINPVPNGVAVVNSGIPVFSGGGCTNFGVGAALPIPTNGFSAITDGASPQSLALAGG